MEESRILLANIGSYDVMHEDSLNQMKILPDFIHKKLYSWLIQLPSRFHSMSALQVWLGINSIPDLKWVVNEFKSWPNRAKMIQVAATGTIPAVANPTLGNDGDVKPSADDQWDKEDIDAIEGQILYFIHLFQLFFEKHKRLYKLRKSLKVCIL